LGVDTALPQLTSDHTMYLLVMLYIALLNKAVIMLCLHFCFMVMVCAFETFQENSPINDGQKNEGKNLTLE